MSELDAYIPSLKDEYDKLSNCGILSPLLYVKGSIKIDYICARKLPSAWRLLFKYLLGDLNLLGFSSRVDSECYTLKNNEGYLANRLPLKVDLLSGSCLFISKALFKDIGWFDEHTFLYYEENILCT